MDENATAIADSESVSDFEFILPWEVIETCCSLKTNASSCFVSVNHQNNTENRLYVSKLEDNSIKIKIAISNVNSTEVNGDGKQENDEKKETQTEKNEVKNGKREQNEDEQVDEQLDRMLKNDDSGVINLNHNNNSSSYNEDVREGFNEGLSTVIIVKKIDGGLDSTLNSSNGDNDYKSDLNTSTRGEGSEKSMGSNRTKSEGGRMNYMNLLSNPEDESDILCEICSEPCENYQQLVQHVKKDHRDCTFVRNYLDEIKTLSFSHCPHCRKEFVAKSSLEAHIKVTHGGQMSKSKLSPFIQKFNINKQELTYSRLYNKQYFTNKINTLNDPPILHPPSLTKVSLERQNRPILDQSDDSSVELNGKAKIKCDICDEDFDTRQQALRHQNKVHRPNNSNKNNSSKDTTTYKCTYCVKSYDSKEQLLKHCLNTHFRSVEDMPVRRKRRGGGDGDDEDEDEFSGHEMVGSDDDNDSEFDDEGGVMESSVQMTRSRQNSKAKKKKNNNNTTTTNNTTKTRSQKKLNSHKENNDTKQQTTPSNNNKSYNNNSNNSYNNSNNSYNNSNNSYNNSNNSSRSVSPSLSYNSGRASRAEFSCNLCGADFNRMTLLVTHARYCRQKCA